MYVTNHKRTKLFLMKQNDQNINSLVPKIWQLFPKTEPKKEIN